MKKIGIILIWVSLTVLIQSIGWAKYVSDPIKTTDMIAFLAQSGSTGGHVFTTPSNKNVLITAISGHFSVTGTVSPLEKIEVTWLKSGTEKISTIRIPPLERGSFCYTLPFPIKIPSGISVSIFAYTNNPVTTISLFKAALQYIEAE